MTFATRGAPGDGRTLPVVSCPTCRPLVAIRPTTIARSPSGFRYVATPPAWIVRAPDRIAAVHIDETTDRGLELGRYYVGHLSTQPGETWRVSAFDNEGAVGHSARATLADALDARCDWPTPESYVVTALIERTTPTTEH